MQHPKAIVTLLRQLAQLVSDQATRDSEFAEKLDAILAPLVVSRPRPTRTKANPQSVPNVFEEFQRLGETEFCLWARSLDLPTLKAVVKLNGFDLSKRSARWTNPEKLITLIAEQVSARLKRGSGFLTVRSGNPTT